MLPPRKLQFEAKKKANENYRFRVFLKTHVNEEELDTHFLELHRELFAHYDCSKCRNCCKEYYGQLQETEVGAAARYLDMKPEDFMDAFLQTNPCEGNYITKDKPCNFLQEDGSCLMGDCKPDNCKRYPYTDQPERMQSLLNMLDTITTCPVAYEIWERLKKVYDWR